MLEYLRPAIALRPPEVTKVLGKTVIKDIKRGNPLNLEDVS